MFKHEQLKEIIVKAVPDIMELTWGCRVKTKNWGTVKITTLKDDGYVDYLLEDGKPADEESMLFYKDEIVEILGRPITLENVLIAINKKDIDYRIMKWGENKIMLGVVDKRDGTLWQLNKPLSEQSEDTIDFLLELLS